MGEQIISDYNGFRLMLDSSQAGSQLLPVSLNSDDLLEALPLCAKIVCRPPERRHPVIDHMETSGFLSIERRRRRRRSRNRWWRGGLVGIRLGVGVEPSSS